MIKANIGTHGVVCNYSGCRECPLMIMFMNDRPHGAHEYEISPKQLTLLKHGDKNARYYNKYLLERLLEADNSDSADLIANALTSKYSFNALINTLLQIAEHEGEKFKCSIWINLLEVCKISIFEDKHLLFALASALGMLLTIVDRRPDLVTAMFGIMFLISALLFLFKEEVIEE